MTDGLRVLHALLAVCGVVLLAILVVVLVIPIDTAFDATRFEQAALCTEQPVVTVYSRVGLSTLLARAPPSVCPESVSLPYKSQSSELQLRRNNAGPMGVAWYLLHYDIPAGWKSDDQLMIYSPRTLGLAWQVRVNNQFIFDDLDDWREGETLVQGLLVDGAAVRRAADHQARLEDLLVGAGGISPAPPPL